MAAGIPLLKLSTLLVKAIAKPLASRLKSESKRSPFIDRVFVGMGNSVHYFYARANVMASGYKFIGVKPLPHDQALRDGVAAFSESLVLGFSAVVIVFDYRRNAIKNAAKEVKMKMEKQYEKDKSKRRLKEIHDRLDRIEELLNDSKNNKNKNNNQGGLFGFFT